MKFKRILAVVLSALMLTSMASFTVSAKEDAELTAAPLLELLVSSDNAQSAKLLKQCERGTATTGYDAENDIVYNHYVPRFSMSGGDNSLYFNMYGLNPTIIPSSRTLYVVTYMRSNVTANSTAGFYQVKNASGGGGTQPTSAAVAYDGSETWKKMVYTINLADDFYSSNHLWIRPIGPNKVMNDDGTPSMSEDTYFDICGVALFDDFAAAEAYDLAALNKAPTITISFDANGGTADYESYQVAPGYIAASNVVFPEAPTAPEGAEFIGWSTSAGGDVLEGDVATPDLSTTYYAIYKYVDVEGVEYDEIYLQNVYSKLYNDKSLTIGYLGGSVTVGAGATVSGANSTTAWRALTTKWFKDNFPNATIKEVYGGIGGTGSRFGSYRMTRDLDLAKNTLDLLFVDSCVNDQYEGFGYSDKEDLWSNDAVIVAKALANNPKCQIVFVNVCNNGTILKAEDYPAVKAHREFADANGFEFIDFKVGMARALMGDDEALCATQAAVDAKWNTYFTDSVHPADAGYKVYFEYLRDELLYELVDDTLTVSKAKYEDTVPADLDVSTVDTNRFCGGTANSNQLAGLSTIKNYQLGQENGFSGGSTMSAQKEGYATTFKFTGTNAYIWANKHSHNALYDVYIDDNTTVGSPDYTIDMWRNQESGQSYMFPVLPEDLDEAREVQVTLVLRQNVDQATRDAAAGKATANVGDRMENRINNIAIKGGTMDSVEFLACPEAFKAEITYDDIVVPNTFFDKKIDGAGALTHTKGVKYPWIDGTTMIDTLKLERNGTAEGNFATDGYGLETYNINLDHYNYVTYYLYVDDPGFKTEGKKIFCNVYQLSGGATSIESTYTITPNAWQRIPISLANAQSKAGAGEVLKQFHFRPFGNGATVQALDGVTLYLEKAVFSVEDPGYWVDLNAKVTNIKVNGEGIDGYNVNTYEYDVLLPFGTTEIPTVTAEKNVNEAIVEVKQADAVDGTATVTLKGATEADDVVYTINFSVFDGIKLNGFTAADKNIAITADKTEYVVALPAGTTEVPEVVADFEGDPAKITVAQADSLEASATITLDDGTVYTITFFVLPSLEEKYEGAKIVYVSEAGAGTKDGSSIDNAYATIKGALAAEAATEGKVVFAVVDDVTISVNADMSHPKDLVITSVGGHIRATSHPTFKANAGAEILIEDIDIYHTRKINDPAKDDINGEIYVVAKGNNLTLKNVNAYAYGKNEVKDVARTAKLYVQPGGDGGNFTKTEPTKLVVENVTGIVLRGGGWGGTTMAGDLEYVIGGTSEVSSIQASGHAVSPTLTDHPENKTINGDVKVTFKDEAKVNSAYAGNGSIIAGDMYYFVEDDAEVGQIAFGAQSSSGSVKGSSFVYVTGGKVDKITTGNNVALAKVVVVDDDNATLGEDVAGHTHLIRYTGDGTVTAAADAEGAVTITLASETAQWAEVTTSEGTKIYDMATDEEVVLSHDMAIAIAEGTTTVVFNSGCSVTYKAYEADGAKADVENVVTGYDGTAVPAPEAVEVKNEYFEFVGWALESDPDKNLVTDFGTFTSNGAVYVAIFKEAPAVQFKAYAADGASADYEKTIYGITGNPVSDKMAAEGVEAPAALENYSFLGWALEGTTEIVTGFGTFADEKAVYVAIYEEDPYVIFKTADDETKVYGVKGETAEIPTVETEEHFTFKGWALEGTTEIVDSIVFDDENKTYVAIIEEDPKFTVTVMDGDEMVAEVTDYTGFTYTFERLAHTPTTRFVGYAADGETEATIFAGDEITVTDNVTYYAVRKEIVLEDAEYTFYGEYDYSEEQYVIEMYYEGPKANMTAFGLAYPTEFTVEYSDEFQSTGTHNAEGEGYYTDVVYPTVGGTFGDDIKTPVLVATITLDMTAEEYAANAYEDFVKYDNDADITGAYAGGEWQYIKNDEGFSLDVESRVYPIYFASLIDDKDITVTVEGVVAEISTVTAPTEGKMLEAITFTVETAEDEEPGLVSYYVDGVAMGELVAGDDGITYTIAAENVLGDVIIELSYGEPILEVTITDIEAPEAQGTPDTEATAGHDTYTIDSVTWEPADEEFAFDTAYTVKVTVTAADEYAFTGKTVYTINGETATVKKIDIDTIELSYTFENTVEELGTLSVVAGLVRDEADAAYANFGTIKVLDAEGTEVASYTEGTEAGNTLATEFEVLAGTYTVVIAKNGYLTYEEEVEVVYNEETEVETDLVAGNLAQAADDEVINLLDFAAITAAFTSEADASDAEALAAYRALVDIDEDGIVTIYDLMYVKANWSND